MPEFSLPFDEFLFIVEPDDLYTYDFIRNLRTRIAKLMCDWLHENEQEMAKCQEYNGRYDERSALLAEDDLADRLFWLLKLDMATRDAAPFQRHQYPDRITEVIQVLPELAFSRADVLSLWCPRVAKRSFIQRRIPRATTCDCGQRGTPRWKSGEWPQDCHKSLCG